MINQNTTTKCVGNNYCMIMIWQLEGNDHDNGELDFTNLGRIQTLEEPPLGSKYILPTCARVGMPNPKPLILWCHLEFKFTQSFVGVSPAIF